MLRTLEPRDLELLYTIENDRSKWWLSNHTAPLSRYQLENYIYTNNADIYKDEQVRFVIEESVDSLPCAVGLVDLFHFDARNLRAELGVCLLNEYQGHGYARKAIEDILDYANEVLHLVQVYAVVPESNILSAKMLTACGFEHTGVLEKWVLHSGKYENARIFQFFCKNIPKSLVD